VTTTRNDQERLKWASRQTLAYVSNHAVSLGKAGRERKPAHGEPASVC
jgi:hypothetical protein